ncbi:T9SS type B sorting domain-containing protein [Flavobacterium ranwuense]|uniref:T9SS type B sorting domain-containing protein n=1 Tax=Flavobacterium ranwuense TaxID=2541725 RepID=A0ABY2DVP9_9FLAO|nr:T9SS type B sorting domain-containing protein [Flavobacterium ranwuense]TDE29917.1 T9SS type B sorting domain-containing protein [Flavobacterium ranwuense]
MEKFIKSFVFIFLITILSNSILFAKNGIIGLECRSVGLGKNSSFFTLEKSSNAKDTLIFLNDRNKNVSIACPVPTVSSPTYYCQNTPPTPLTATALMGNTLIWYGTATGGIPSATPPIPSRATVGSTTYYVSQTDGVCESARVAIVVNIVADNGATILNFRCDASQILAADKASSVFFDWSNNPLISNSYNFTYTIQGSSPVTGNTGVSHVQVFGMLPGQSATLKLSSATHPCVPSLTITCSVPCGASTTTPNFPAIAPFCSGTTAPILTNTSPNGITGTWSPALINNTTSGSYVFTPNPTLFPCATTQTLNVTVRPLVTPTFTGIPATVCQNATAPILPTSSSNATPITGTWSPATVNTAVLGPAPYTFTPNSGQCVSSPTTTITITVNPNITPTFTQVPPICSGAVLSALPTTSNNNFTGTWSPALNNTATTTYTFTPTAGQCATTTTMTITVTPNGTPKFNAVSPICTGTPLAPLPTTSNNNYTGSWSPALNNTVTTIYTFTPDAGQCATTATLTITVNPLRTPVFNTVPTTVCENDPPLVLPTRSSDTPAITGAWSPPAVDTSILGASDYTFTPDAGQCAATITKSITVAPSNTLVDVSWTVTEAFAKNQIITINATAAGDYLYQLDDGPFQESPVFEYVSLGTHSITVQDKNGCSLPITKTNVLVINYPKFFTPNNDGYNDSWNIFALQDQSSSKILIFDRYGKFLKEIFPNGSGWDGTYIGQPMPANDYWFSIEYTEQDIPKKFKSHFSLKR